MRLLLSLGAVAVFFICCVRAKIHKAGEHFPSLQFASAPHHISHKQQPSPNEQRKIDQQVPIRQPNLNAGDAVRPTQFQFFVHVITVDGKDVSQCGGSLISEDWVLLAGHCVIDKYGDKFPTNRVMITGGVLDVNDWRDGVNWIAEDIVLHPEYSRGSAKDLALIRIRTKDQYPNSARISSILLPYGRSDFDFTTRACYILGSVRTKTTAGRTLQYNQITWVDGNFNDYHLETFGYGCPADSGSPMVCIHWVAGVETLKIHGVVASNNRKGDDTDCGVGFENRRTNIVNLEYFEMWIRSTIDL